MNGMTIIVKTISTWVKILIVLFGIYLILLGDISPGGGFAGGVIIAGSYILLMLAFGRDFVKRNLPSKIALAGLCIGALAFVSVALSGLFIAEKGFFYNWIYQTAEHTQYAEPALFHTGTITIAEIAIGLAVGAGLFLAIFNLAVHGSSKKNPENVNDFHREEKQ